VQAADTGNDTVTVMQVGETGADTGYWRQVQIQIQLLMDFALRLKALFRFLFLKERALKPPRLSQGSGVRRLWVEWWI
jgi:hypothetical protein